MNVLKGFIAFVGVVLLIMVGFLVFKPIERGVEMSEEVNEQTMTGQNAIYNYEWFKRKKNSIENLREQEKIAQAQLEDFKEVYGEDPSEWSSDVRQERRYLKNDITGLNQRISEAISEYNARSEMVNRSVFKDDLPTNILRGADQSLEFQHGNNN